MVCVSMRDTAVQVQQEGATYDIDISVYPNPAPSEAQFDFVRLARFILRCVQLGEIRYGLHVFFFECLSSCQPVWNLALVTEHLARVAPQDDPSHELFSSYFLIPFPDDTRQNIYTAAADWSNFKRLYLTESTVPESEGEGGASMVGLASSSPLICLICGTIIPCDFDCHLDCNPFINSNTAPFPRLQQEPLLFHPLLQVGATAREPTAKKQYSHPRIPQHQHQHQHQDQHQHQQQQHRKFAPHGRVIIVTASAKDERQYRTAATRHARNCPTQTLDRRQLISTIRLVSPLQNSSLPRLPNRPGRRTSLDPVPRFSPADQHLLLLPLVLHHQPELPDQAHLQKPHAQPERSILLQLNRREQDQDQDQDQEDNQGDTQDQNQNQDQDQDQDQERNREPEPELTGPFLILVTRTPRPKGIEAVSTATGLFQRLHTLHHRTTIDQLNSPP